MHLDDEVNWNRAKRAFGVKPVAFALKKKKKKLIPAAHAHFNETDAIRDGNYVSAAALCCLIAHQRVLLWSTEARIDPPRCRPLNFEAASPPSTSLHLPPPPLDKRQHFERYRSPADTGFNMLWTCQQARGEKEKSRPPRGSSFSDYSTREGGEEGWRSGRGSVTRRRALNQGDTFPIYLFRAEMWLDLVA